MTGTAWQISCDRENNAKYQYYQGPFKDGIKVNNENQQTNLTEKDINKLLKEKDFDLTLTWDEKSFGIE